MSENAKVNTYEGSLDRALEVCRKNGAIFGLNSSFLRRANGAMGYAISVMNDSQHHGKIASMKLTDKYFERISKKVPYLHWKNTYEKHYKSAGQINAQELVNLSRSLNWEMNRVRLPLPNNWRQINFTTIAGTGAFDVKHKSGRFAYYYMTNESVLEYWRLIDTLTQLKLALKGLREVVRREIDAANLARQVQEETLRREEEELRTREANQQAALERAIAIAAEREAAAEAIIEAERVRNEEAAAAAAALLEQAESVPEPDPFTGQAPDNLTSAPVAGKNTLQKMALPILAYLLMR